MAALVILWLHFSTDALDVMAGGLLQTVGDFDFVQENKCDIEYTVLVDEFAAVVDAQGACAFHQVVQLADVSGEVAALESLRLHGRGASTSHVADDAGGIRDVVRMSSMCSRNKLGVTLEQLNAMNGSSLRGDSTWI